MFLGMTALNRASVTIAIQSRVMLDVNMYFLFLIAEAYMLSQKGTRGSQHLPEC